MGPAHSLSGAAAWLGRRSRRRGGRTPDALARPSSAAPLICAGAALAPDLDHKAATISRAFGPISRWICEIVDKLSYAVYKATRKQGDPRRSGGHRTLTHTWVWAVLIGAGCSVAAITGAGGRCWASCSCTWCSRSRACCGGRRAVPAATSWSGCWRRRARGSWRACWTSRATAPTGCSPRRGRSTCGWGCRSCWVRWCTTSGTR
ncbi:metal-dependent hydrolase [Streptomyces tricolor]|nr:metal-dependent hydrolase [Streptomyces tricolor]